MCESLNVKNEPKMSQQNTISAPQMNEDSEDPSIIFGKHLANALPGEEVVISGASGKYPESNNINEFAENLFNKIDMITDDPRRWDHEHHEIPRRSGKIPFIEKFDAGFFGIPHKRSTSSEPTLRKTLEVVVEAIFDAGINLCDLENTKTGVFVATAFHTSSDYWYFNNRKPNYDAILGCALSMVAQQISYALKLKGPSFVLDAACSGSLFAFEHAYKAIRRGQCETAIVVGCNIGLQPLFTLDCVRLGVLSPDGIGKPMDANGQGYVRSENITACILQRAKNAKRVYCTVVHAKTNCDGFKDSGITFPSAERQTVLLKEIYAECGVKTSEISFLEAHSAGTKAGDPEELKTITNAILEGRDRRLLIGTLKSNIGHTENASGLASVIKGIIAMETGYIPPNINYEKPVSSSKALVEGRLQVVTTKHAFEDDNGCIAINNFGFGGTNSHAVLRRNQKVKLNRGFPQDDILRIVCVSGRTEEAVKALLDSVDKTRDIEYMRLLQDIFRKNLRGHHYRGFILLNRHGEIYRSSKFVGMKKKQFYLAFGELNNIQNIFKELLELPVFSDTMNKIHEILLRRKVAMDGILKQNETYSYMNHNLVSGFIEIGVIELIKAINLKPSGFFGNHSIAALDESIGAYVDGNLNLEETIDCLYSALADTSEINQLQCQNGPHCNGDYKYQKLGSAMNQTDKSLISRKLESNSVILQIGEVGENFNSLFKKMRCCTLSVSSGIHDLLASIGQLYEAGHNVDVHKLFPPVEFPVSRGTPMISPEIKWNHDRDWFVARYSVDECYNKQIYVISLEEKDWAFVAGNIVDGNSLFPATGYLLLAWKALGRQLGMNRNSMEVVFENCKFHRLCFVQEGVDLKLMVTLQTVGGNFEVLEGDNIVATGRIYVPQTSDQRLSIPEVPATPPRYNVKMSSKDIYKELRLRGYQYRGDLQGVQEFDVGNSIAQIKWNENWVTFLENMLQLQILNQDTRLLQVPTSIKRIYLNAPYHKELVKQSSNNILEAHFHKYSCSRTICSGGVEIRGFNTSVINRKKNESVPLLEEYTFVANKTTLTLEQSLKVNMYLLLENSEGHVVKIVEVIDDATEKYAEPLSPSISEIFFNTPLVISDIKILTRHQMIFDNIQVENRSLSKEVGCSLVIGTKLLQRHEALNAAWNCLKPDGLILSRESSDLDISGIAKDITVISVHLIDTEKFIFFAKSKFPKNCKLIKVPLADEKFTWLAQLQAAVNNEENVIVYSQNDPLNGIIGLVRCMRTEPSKANVKAFFILDDAPDFDPDHPFYCEQINKNMAINVFKNGAWGTYRHLDIDKYNETTAEHCFVNVAQEKNLFNVRWVQGNLKMDMKTEPNETLLVEIYYTGLSRRDVTLATGKVSMDVIIDRHQRSQGHVPGIEYSGLTKDGRRVMGLVPTGALTTLIMADTSLLWDIPNHWSLEDAATVPAAYLICLHAFLQRGNLKSGESVLIHAGNPDIGLAAITLALEWGCTVYTTVNKKEDGTFLLNHFSKLTDSNVLNVRDTSIEVGVMKATKGQGVDVILHCIIEENPRASVNCLANKGRYLRIGDFDFANDNSLNLLFLQKEATFHGVAVDCLFNGNAVRTLELYNFLKDGIASGIVRPLTRTVYSDKEVEKAMNFMSLGNHIGNTLIKIREEVSCQLGTTTAKMHKCLARYYCDKEQVYIICGGLGGFGLELANWLVLRGCRKLILTSRKGVTTGYQRYRIQVWSSYRCVVHISSQDITTKYGTEELIKEGKALGSIAAIFNLAVVLQDSVFENQTIEDFQTCFKPKAYATRNLDEVTRKRCPELKQFVIFSSVTCGRGNPGQTNYGMANSVMERICEKRREDGYPALAIEWGAIGDAGILADLQEQKNNEILIRGTKLQRMSSCLEALDIFLTKKTAAIVSSLVVAEKHFAAGNREDAVSAVATILRINDLKSVSFQATLAELGMDSLSVIEIKQMLEKEFKLILTVQDIKSLSLSRLQEIQPDV